MWWMYSRATSNKHVLRTGNFLYENFSPVFSLSLSLCLSVSLKKTAFARRYTTIKQKEGKKIAKNEKKMKLNETVETRKYEGKINERKFVARVWKSGRWQWIRGINGTRVILFATVSNDLKASSVPIVYQLRSKRQNDDHRGPQKKRKKEREKEKTDGLQLGNRPE